MCLKVIVRNTGGVRVENLRLTAAHHILEKKHVTQFFKNMLLSRNELLLKEACKKNHALTAERLPQVDPIP